MTDRGPEIENREGADFSCDDRTFWCLSFDRKIRIGDIGEQAMSYHAATASCRACDSTAYNQRCNATYPAYCDGRCYTDTTETPC